MKKNFLLILLSILLLLTSCSMEEVIPEQSDTFSLYFENEELYALCVEEAEKYSFDFLISRGDYFAPEGSENFTSLYLQNMSDSTFSSVESDNFRALFESSEVKLVDALRKEDLFICCFDMCVPGRNFDYGIYYVSQDEPIYLGDPAVSLTQNGTGFSYEQKASYGTKFTFYTEKITDHFYYYEIT